MKIAARAVCGSPWLVWLTLLVVALAGAGKARPSSHSSAARTRAYVQAGSLGHAVSAHVIACDDSTDNQDELPSNAALPPEAARAPRRGISRLARGQSGPGDCGSPAPRRSPRAPPIPVLL